MQGFVKPGFEKVQAAYADILANTTENSCGAQFAVVKSGEVVVNLWHGTSSNGQPWQEDTIVNLFSAGKGVVALAIGMCVDRGLLDYNAKVSTYWPEFSQAGKDSITVGQVLSHQAGLSGIRRMKAGDPTAADFLSVDFGDWEKWCAQLARQRPYYEAGAYSAYHNITYGYLAGELIRRVTGKSIGDFVRSEISRPLGVDFFFGVPESEDDRVGKLVLSNEGPLVPPPNPSLKKLDNELFEAVLTAWMNPSQDMVDGEMLFNTSSWRRPAIPGANGHSSAVSLAKIYGCLALGGTMGDVPLLSMAGVEKMTQLQCRREDLALRSVVHWAHGFMLNDPIMGGMGPNVGTFGHIGAGGAMAFADPNFELGVGATVGLLKPAFARRSPSPWTDGDARTLYLLEVLYACLGQPFSYDRLASEPILPIMTRRSSRARL